MPGVWLLIGGCAPGIFHFLEDSGGGGGTHDCGGLSGVKFGLEALIRLTFGGSGLILVLKIGGVCLPIVISAEWRC